MEPAELMDSNFARFGCHGMPGSFLYPVTGADGSVTRGERLINWGCYVEMPAADLDDFFIDREGRRHDGTIPPGHLRLEHESRFKAMARESLSPTTRTSSPRVGTPSRRRCSRLPFPTTAWDESASPATRGRWRRPPPAAASSRRPVASAVPQGGQGGAPRLRRDGNAINLGRALSAHEDVDEAQDRRRHHRARPTSIRDEGFTFVASTGTSGRQYDRAFMDTASAAEWLGASDDAQARSSPLPAV
jgi:FAD binding domain-like